MPDTNPFGEPLPSPEHLARRAAARSQEDSARTEQQAREQQIALLRPAIEHLREALEQTRWLDPGATQLPFPELKAPSGYTDLGRQILSEFLAQSNWALAPGTVWAAPEAGHVRYRHLILVPLDQTPSSRPHPALDGVGRRGG